jgi:hypothetical protein
MNMFIPLSRMSVNEDWDNWIDKFVEKIGQIVGSEGIKCEQRSVVSRPQIPDDNLVYTKTITNLVRGSQVYVDTVKKRQKAKSRAMSIGQIYEAAILDLIQDDRRTKGYSAFVKVPKFKIK